MRNNKFIAKSFGVLCLMTLVLSFLSGCGGGGSKNNPVATSSTPAGAADDKTTVTQLVTNAPYMGTILGEDVPPLSKGKYSLPPGVSSVVRSAMTATRQLQSTFISGTTAYVPATFTLAGTLTFKDASGATVNEKPISMQSSGNYVLQKETDGHWKIMEDAAENLTFESGNAGGVSITDVNLEPAFVAPGGTQKVEVVLSSTSPSPEFFVAAKIVALGLKVYLVDDGTNGDAVAGDHIYTAEVTYPATAAEGTYIGVLDIIEKSESFDLTKDAANTNFVSPYTGMVTTRGMTVGTLKSITLSSSATTTDVGGAVVNFMAQGTFSSGTVVDVTHDVTWNSSNTAVGQISGPGYFYGVSAGTTTVTAAIGNITSNALDVTVAQGTAAGGGGTIPPTGGFSAPANVFTSPADGAIVLAWDPVVGAVSYNVYMAEAAGVTKANYSTLPGGMAHTGITTNAFTHTGLTNGTAYYFVVTAVDASGAETSESAEVFATPTNTVPPSPINVMVTPGDGNVTIAWDPVSAAASFNIYMASQSGVSPSNYTSLPDGQVFQANSSVGFFTVTGLTNGTTYYFVVTAVDASGESAPSIEVSATPTAASSMCGNSVCEMGETFATCPADCTTGSPITAPVNVFASPLDSSAELMWDPVLNAASYNVYMASASGVTPATFSTLPDGQGFINLASPLSITGLVNGTTYYFIVTAVDANGVESAPSAEVTATPVVGGGALTAPVNVLALPGSGGGDVILSWGTVAGAVSYNVYYATATGVTAANYSTLSGGATLQGVVAPQVFVNGLAIGAAYYFVVTAVDAAGESAASVEVSATPMAPSTIPLNVMATPGNGDVSLMWGPVTGAIHYNVYYATVSGVTAANYTGLPGGGTSSGVVSTSTVISGLTNGTAYYFVVTAVDAAGESAASVEVSATPAVPPLSAPVNVMAAPGNGSTSLSWYPVIGAASYNVYYATVAGVTKANYTGLPGGATSTGIAMATTTITGLTNSTTYYFVVTAVDASAVESVESSEVSATPSAPALMASMVAGGGNHTCGVLSNGTVKCWGYNLYGQLGDGTTTSSSTPVAVSGITTATAVSAGTDHTCALLSGGTVQCWGYNLYGQLGDGTTTGSVGPVTVSGITTATAIAAGGSHTCALLSGGTMTCWGINAGGQLGDGTTTNSSIPVMVSGVSTATAITAGEGHTCALLTGGTMTCWGNNPYGQLGDGTTTNSSIPVMVSGVSTATAIAAGWNHTCAALSDGTMKCWGYNLYGQLGDGTTTNSSTPVLVSGIGTSAAVAAGANHTCALFGGAVTCWGANTFGALGNGTNTDLLTAASSVSGMSTAAMVAAGGDHTCAVKSDGTVACWGDNSSGALGDGTTTNSNVPVSVSSGLYAMRSFLGKISTFASRMDALLKLKVFVKG